MPDANSKYDVEVHMTVTDVSPNKEPRVEFEDTAIWRGVNYGVLVGLEDTINSAMEDTIGWGKAMAEVLGQPVPSDIGKNPPKKR